MRLHAFFLPYAVLKALRHLKKIIVLDTTDTPRKYRSSLPEFRILSIATGVIALWLIHL